MHHVLLESSMMMVMRALHAWTARLGTFLLVHLLCARSVQRASTTMMATLRPHVTILTPRVQQVTMQGRVRSAVTSARLDDNMRKKSRWSSEALRAFVRLLSFISPGSQSWLEARMFSSQREVVKLVK